MAGALLVALPLHGLWQLVRLPSPWPRLLLGTIARIAGARRRIHGRPLRREVFFVANHLSWLDILLLAGATGTAFVAKAELQGVPLIGWLCSLNRTLFVSRNDRMAVAGQIAEVRAALEDGWAVTIFPEGTTGDGRTLLPFKAALLAVLDPAPAGVRVQPVTIDYGYATAELAWQDESGIENVKRILARPGVFSANLTFQQPFDPADHPDRKAIAAEARRRMVKHDILAEVVSPDRKRKALLYGRSDGLFWFEETFEDTDEYIGTYWNVSHQSGLFADRSLAEGEMAAVMPWLNHMVRKR